MSSIMKNGQQFGGVPKEVITAWEPGSNDKVVVKPTSIQSIVDIIYPVGSIYMSVNSTSPAVLFGGTWAQIQDTFLLAAGSTYSAGDTGGEATHILTTSETPAHTHERGTMNITGTVTMHGQEKPGLFNGITGAFAANRHESSAYVTQADLTSRTYSGGSDSGFNFDASRNWTGSTSSVGGNGAHNNMPPYLAVYMWKRTA